MAPGGQNARWPRGRVAACTKSGGGVDTGEPTHPVIRTITCGTLAVKRTRVTFSNPNRSHAHPYRR